MFWGEDERGALCMNKSTPPILASTLSFTCPPPSSILFQLRYPPSLDQKMESAAEELAAIMKDLAGVKDAVDEQVQVS